MGTPTYSYSTDGDMFSGESYPSRKSALAAAVKECTPGSTVYTGRNEDLSHTSTFVPSASDFLTYVQERAYDEIGECTDGWLIAITDDQEAQVQAHLDAIASLVQDFDPPHFYQVVDIETHALPKA